jgi:hypothetical protein
MRDRTRHIDDDLAGNLNGFSVDESRDAAHGV